MELGNVPSRHLRNFDAIVKWYCFLSFSFFMFTAGILKNYFCIMSLICREFAKPSHSFQLSVHSSELSKYKIMSIADKSFTSF